MKRAVRAALIVGAAQGTPVGARGDFFWSARGFRRVGKRA